MPGRDIVDESGAWPEPPPPRHNLTWTPSGDGSWTAVGPTGMSWRLDEADGRWSITLGTWSRADWWADTDRSAMALVETFEARHDEPMVPVLGVSWEEVGARQARYREEAEQHVVEWAWGPFDAAWERLEPFWQEQHGGRPKKRRLATPTPPKSRSSARLYGFDREGRVVVSRTFSTFDRLERETVHVRGRSEMILVFEGVRAPEPRLEELHVPRRDADGRLQRLDIWFGGPHRDGYTWWGTAYAYEDGRVSHIWSSRLRAPYTGWQHHRVGGSRLAEIEVTRRDPLRLRYDGDGQLLMITAGPSGDPGSVVYRRMPRGAAARSTSLVREALPERIVQWVRRNAPHEELYCLAISYPEHYNSPLPPALGLGTARELQDRNGAGAEPDPTMVWNPAEFAIFDPEPAELTEAAELVDAYQVLNQEWLSTDDDRGPRRLMVAVAKSLAACDWGGLQISPHGFAVYAVDLELADLERNLRASVPEAVRSALMHA